MAIFYNYFISCDDILLVSVLCRSQCDWYISTSTSISIVLKKKKKKAIASLINLCSCGSHISLQDLLFLLLPGSRSLEAGWFPAAGQCVHLSGCKDKPQKQEGEVVKVTPMRCEQALAQAGHGSWLQVVVAACAPVTLLSG